MLLNTDTSDEQHSVACSSLQLFILEDMKVELSDSSSKTQDTTNSISSTCQMKVNEQIKANTAMNPNNAVDSFVSCAQPLVPI
jgi:hypothetical protein